MEAYNQSSSQVLDSDGIHQYSCTVYNFRENF